MDYIMHYDAAALVITVTIMIHFYMKKTISTRQNRMFSLLIVMALLSNILDILSVALFPYTQNLPMWIQYAANQGYLITFNATSVIYYIYLMVATKEPGTFTSFDKVRMFLPAAVEALLILTTPWTNWIFYFENGVYKHGYLMIVLYGCAMLYVLMSLGHTILYQMKLNISQKVSVYVYTLLCFGAVVLQMELGNVMIVQFAVSIAVMLIYLSLENPESYIDRQLGIYNQVAFARLVPQYFEREKSFEILGIRVDGYRYIGETLGMENAWILLRKIAEDLSLSARHMDVCYLSGNEFAVISGESEANFLKLIKRIQDRFQKPFFLNGMEISLSAQLCRLSCPENAKSLEDVMDALDYTMQETGQAENHVIEISNDILKKKKRENQILQILKKAVSQNAFKVYYQPIYSVEKECFSSAEALIRLQNEELGFISPEEFIPMAEKNGLILSIGEYVFRSVCKMMQREQPWNYGIDYIEVNLSVVQCMQEKLYKRLFEIMDEYQISYHQINLEITETTAIVSKETLWRNMHKLLARGVTFSLDDYGTGFSNTATIITYPFHLVKLDKSMVWSAMESDKAMCALKHTISMIKEMGMCLVAEGVETKEQANQLKEMGCDFFQGYYYSKPVPVDTFLELIKKQG